MTKQEIVDELAHNKEVEKMVYKISKDSKNPFDALDDLIQDVYIFLLDMDDELITRLYNNKQLGFYLLRVIRNQLLSANSRYFYKYIKPTVCNDSITTETEDTIESD